MKKFDAQEMLQDGMTPQNVSMLKTQLETLGVPKDTIDEIVTMVEENNAMGEDQTPQLPDDAYNSEDSRGSLPPKDENVGVKRVLQPGKQLATNLTVSADEFLRRLDASSRLQLCADDLAAFEEEVTMAAEHFIENEGMDVDAAWDLAERTIFEDFFGGQGE